MSRTQSRPLRRLATRRRVPQYDQRPMTIVGAGAALARFGHVEPTWDLGLIWPCTTAVAERGHGPAGDLSRPGAGDAGHSVHRGDDRCEFLDLATVSPCGDLGDHDRDRDLATDAPGPVDLVGSARVGGRRDDGRVVARSDRAARA